MTIGQYLAIAFGLVAIFGPLIAYGMLKMARYNWDDEGN